MFIAFVLHAEAQDSAYQTSLQQLRERLEELQIQRADYRKIRPDDRSPKLPPAQEAERYSLLGQLFSDDPIWALQQQLQADIDALADASKPEVRAANRAVLEDLKDLGALISAFEGRVPTREQADAMVAALRQFIARRDVDGARAWAKKPQIP